MGITVAEDLLAPVYRFTDPDAFVTCDSRMCEAPWLTGAGLVCWALDGHWPEPGRFSERLLFGCNAACLGDAQEAWRGRSVRWSPAMSIRDWLDNLRSSLDIDPRSTPIGSFRTG